MTSFRCYDNSDVNIITNFYLWMRSFEMIWIRIRDPRSLGSWYIKRTDEFTLDKDSSVHVIYHDPSDLGSLIPIQIIAKEHTVQIFVNGDVVYAHTWWEILSSHLKLPLLKARERQTKIHLISESQLHFKIDIICKKKNTY